LSKSMTARPDPVKANPMPSDAGDWFWYALIASENASQLAESLVSQGRPPQL